MKKYYLILTVAAFLAAWNFSGFDVSAQTENAVIENAPVVSTSVVISQFQAGGISNANDEFIELHNVSSSPVDLNGYNLFYRSSSGTNDVGPFANWSASTIIQPGGYYLIASTAYIGSAAADKTYNPTVCSCSMSATAGGLGIRNGAANTGTIIDAVGWGGAINIFFEGTRTAAPANSTSQARLQNGCQDTDNNFADFSNLNPSVPRNSATAPVVCGGSSGTLSGSGAASPNQVAPGGLTLLTVTVTPATTPPSTGITVNADLTSISASATQQLFDDGTNGDATAGDNIFSYFAIVPANATGGVRTLPVSIADVQARTASTNIGFTVTAPADPAENMAMGNPSEATTDVNNPLNYLLVKTQYVVSYNRDRGTPNWVSWHLDSTNIGSTNRQNDFRPDPSLPASWYQVLDTDYSGSGFDRGHHCPSGDRTDTVANNSATFFMTNMMPQAPNNNQGPWNLLEVYSRTLAQAGNELYIVAGGTGIGGTGLNGGTTNIINTPTGGHITVPEKTWKVIIVLPNGSNDVDRVTKNTRVIAVIMPNQQSIGINTPWQNFRVSVRQVEALTGYTFFTNVRPLVRHLLKLRADTQ